MLWPPRFSSSPARSIPAPACKPTCSAFSTVYRRQGFYAARVDPKIINLDNNRIDVVFEINEGPTTKVRAINFIGNEAFSDSQLRFVISTTQTNILSFLKGTNIYDPDRLNLDRELLRQFYLKSGYADVRILSATADLDRDGRGFFITFTIDEGERYRFGTVNIESALPSLNVDISAATSSLGPGASTMPRRSRRRSRR